MTSIYQWPDFQGHVPFSGGEWADDPLVGDPPASRTLRPADVRGFVDQLVRGDREGIRLACLLVDSDTYRLDPDAYDRIVKERSRIARMITAPHGPARRSPGNLGYRWIIRNVPICLFEFQEDAELPSILALARLTKSTRTWIPDELHQLPARKAKQTSASARRARTARSASTR